MFFVIMIGIALGIITGLTPGIHINLIATLLVSLSPHLLNYTTPLNLTIIIIAMGITHTFLDFIPSTYLGAPSDDTAMSALPAHKYLLKGKAQEAIMLATIGSFLGLLMTILFSSIFIAIFPLIAEKIKQGIPFILITLSLALIAKEKNNFTFIIFSLASILGIIILNNDNFIDPLFPLFSGLFGTSMLLLSINDKTYIPKQENQKLSINRKEIIKDIATATSAATLTGFLPGLGAAQAAIIATSFRKETTEKAYIIIVGAINTVIMMISIITFYTIHKARNGAIIAVTEIIKDIDSTTMLIFFAVAIITAGIANILTIYLSKLFAKMIIKVNYQKLCITIMSIITILVIVLTGIQGLLILITATALGILTPLKKVSRHHLMACLITPIIIYFL